MKIISFFKDWKARYLHADYQKSLEPNATIEQVRHRYLKIIAAFFSHDQIELYENIYVDFLRHFSTVKISGKRVYARYINFSKLHTYPILFFVV